MLARIALDRLPLRQSKRLRFRKRHVLYASNAEKIPEDAPPGTGLEFRPNAYGVIPHCHPPSPNERVRDV